MLRVTTQMMRGVSTPNRAHRGLYAGKQIVYGWQLADDKKTPKHTSRQFKPNVQTKRFFSPTLNETLQIRVTTKAIRCIDKAGGIDEYVAKTKAEPNSLLETLQQRMFVAQLNAALAKPAAEETDVAAAITAVEQAPAEPAPTSEASRRR
jgi:large subunit ribosomal protein L28